MLATVWAATGCGSAVDPQVACQERLIAAGDAPPANDDVFGYRHYAELARSGCSARQLATLDRLAALTKALPALSDANERAAAIGEKAHMAAFQRMNDALIELNDLQQAADADLARMEVPQ